MITVVALMVVVMIMATASTARHPDASSCSDYDPTGCCSAHSAAVIVRLTVSAVAVA